MGADPHWRDCLLFQDYFHGDTGKGLGASHQTGWTGLLANLIDAWRREVLRTAITEVCMAEAFPVINSRLDLVDQLEAVQRACFPTLAEDEIITAAHYAVQIQRFPEGQLAVLDNATGRVVACSTDFLTSDVDFERVEHRYIEVVDHNWLGHHDPAGDWLYGADIGVHPEFRRRGIASRLYRARQALVRQLGLQGHVAGGLLRGFGPYKSRLSAETYVAKVVAGEIFDPTLSVQLKCGFTVHGIIEHYVDDPACDGKAAFIVWRNPEYEGPIRLVSPPR